MTAKPDDSKKKQKTLTNFYQKYKDTISYFIFGVLTTLVNIVCFWLYHYPLDINYQVANVIAYFLLILFAYVLTNYGF
ncbi:GtrA family protein [Companilactobacillus furfuricola]|uniref:GtrA family protein n=1 Tax=Companilactobacillus furfuricola TaxID=1462575 RepID=UPI00319E7325